jgi:hypothetical protein
LSEEIIKERHYHPEMPTMDAVIDMMVFISNSTEPDRYQEVRIENIYKKIA